MEAHLKLSDQVFAQQFRDCTMDPKIFSHEAHLRLAWIHINNYGIDKACNNICKQLKQFDRTFGDGTKFNKTLTIAAIRAVYHFMLKSSSDDFLGFKSEFPRLFTDLKGLLDQHYGFDIYHSEEAKNFYLQPDILPFD